MHTARTLRTLAALALVTLIACEPGAATGPSDPQGESFAPSLGIDLSKMTKISNDLYYEDKVVGTGTSASVGKMITVAYVGYFVNGTTFESNDSFGPELLADGNLITGWAYGIPNMKVGGVRRLVIGSSWAYGSKQVGSIPPNSTLIFDVTLKGVQ